MWVAMGTVDPEPSRGGAGLLSLAEPTGDRDCIGQPPLATMSACLQRVADYRLITRLRSKDCRDITEREVAKE
jgi:hypothetical protein